MNPLYSDAVALTVDFGKSFEIRRDHRNPADGRFLFIGPYSDSSPIEISYRDKCNIEKAFYDYKQSYINGTFDHRSPRQYSFYLESNRLFDRWPLAEKTVTKVEEPKLNRKLLLL